MDKKDQVVEIAEENPRDREAKLRAITDSAFDAIILIDHLGEISFWNQGAERMFGYKSAEVMGKDVHKLLAPREYHPVYRSAFKTFSGTGQGNAIGKVTELFACRKNGERFPMELSLASFQINGHWHAAGIIRDITERKQIQESVLRLAAIVEFSDDAIIGKTLDGTITSWNAGAEKLYGYSADEVEGQNISILLPHESLEDLPDILERLNRGEVISHYETKRRRKDGGIIDVSLTISPIKTPEGQIIGISSTARDITDIKRLEKERFEMAQKALQTQKLESLHLMAAGIAHDFNNQLMVVVGNLDLAIEDLPRDSEALTSVQNAIKASERMADLSMQMLLYTGSTLFSAADINLNDLLVRNLDTFKTRVPDHVRLDLELGDRLPHIKGDVDQIMRLVMNILTNASEAIGDNRGSILVSTGAVDCDEKYLQLSLLEQKTDPGRFVFLEVKDTGCGMDTATIQKLFDPFFTTKFTGRGLGMAEVRGIVMSHRGAFFVFSQIGKGTTIRVLFPSPKEDNDERS